VACGRAGGGGALRRESALVVERPGAEPDLALVDVAVSRARFVGARALWRAEDLTELIVTFASPSAVGLSAVAGLLRPLERGGGRGLHVRLARDAGEASVVLEAPLAPGLVAPVPIAGFRELETGDDVRLEPAPGCLALDGERELERRAGEPVVVRLTQGPLTIDVDEVMRRAAGRISAAASPPRE
jgi:hypothetical protein